MTVAEPLILNFETPSEEEEEEDHYELGLDTSKQVYGALSAATSSSPSVAPEEQLPPPPTHAEYVVLEGETLYSIARDVLLDIRLADLLFEINKPTLETQHSWPLRYGMTLLLPTAYEINVFLASKSCSPQQVPELKAQFLPCTVQSMATLERVRSA